MELAIVQAFVTAGLWELTPGVFDNKPAALHCYISAGFKDTEQDTYYSIKGESRRCLELEMKKDSFG